MHGFYHIGIAYAKFDRLRVAARDRLRVAALDRLRAAALVLGLMALLSACGSYTKADFTARADAICAGAVRHLRTLAPPSFGAGSVVQERSLAGYLDRALPILSAEASQLRGLRRPGGRAGARAELDHYLQALSQNLADYRRLAASAAGGNLRAVAGAESALGASDVDSLADRYGILSCGAPGATFG